MDKLAVSNIAWTHNAEYVLERLAESGVQGVEVAPGKIIGGWQDLDEKRIMQYRSMCARFDLVIPSFQAFLYGKPELQLLGDETSFNALKQHMCYVASLAQTAGAKILVFGAPKNRLLLNYTKEYGTSLAKERLLSLADICWEFNVSIGLEAVPKIYGGEIITSYKESSKIVNDLNHPGLLFHLDTGCTYLEAESIAEAIQDNSIAHFHISQPKLINFEFPYDYHLEASDALRLKGYQNWKCIEMLESRYPIKDVDNAVAFVKKIYR